MRTGDGCVERQAFRGETAKAVNAAPYQKGAAIPAEKPELPIGKH
jgi:hypothetical protein